MNGPLRAELAQVASALDLPVARLHAIAVTALLASYHASGRRLILPLHPATPPTRARVIIPFPKQ